MMIMEWFTLHSEDGREKKKIWNEKWTKIALSSNTVCQTEPEKIAHLKEKIRSKLGIIFSIVIVNSIKGLNIYCSSQRMTLSELQSK